MAIEIESPEQLGYDTIACNLSESSIADLSLSDLDLDLDLGRLLLCYGDHLGHPGLREQIAARGAGLSPDDVIVTPGAAAALFCVATAHLDRGDHMVVARPNYATNIETPRAVGAAVDYCELRFEDGYRLDLDRLSDSIRADTKLVSLTCPHNPTGAMLSSEDLLAVIELVERAGTLLLFDETYRDLTHGQPLPMAASLSPNAISVASMSKAYGLPGLRIGWAVSRNPAVAELLLAAKEQIFICGATLDEEIASRVLAEGERILGPIKAVVEERRLITEGWIADDTRFEWVPPSGGVVCFPRFREDVEVDVDRFYDVLLGDLGTYVGAGHWFEQDHRSMRIGYGWPDIDQLRQGLDNISVAADRAGG